MPALPERERRNGGGGMTHHTGSVPEQERAVDWRDAAACRDEDRELFFPNGSTGPWALQIEEAKKVCRRCPSMGWCRQWALAENVEFGVWGALSEEDRRRLKRAVRPARQRSPETLQFTKTGTLEEQCQELFSRYTDIQGEHLVWTSSRTSISLHGRERTYAQIGFQAGHRRWPDGQVKTVCDVWRCVAPRCLTDRKIREARKAAAVTT
jgi:WhiB family redox-sensing transcriptional regulator